MNTKKNKMKQFSITLFIVLFALVQLHAQTDTDPNKDYLDLTLEELLDLDVNVTSAGKSSNILDAPGIVTVVSENEIASSGARDIIDVLRLVPGFSFASDVESQLGIVNRGNWATEGKILLMIDGQMMNELSYATMVLGNHIPIENIQRIEIIRGPGSAIYGGNAEMSVINIITKTGENISGIEGGISHGSTENVPSFRKAAYLSIGKKIKDFEFSLFGKAEQGHRSDRTYTDLYGSSFNMTENTTDPQHVNINAKYKNLEIRGIYDNYKTKTRDFNGENLLKAYQMDYISQLAEIKYKYEVTDKLSILPKINYKRDTPWLSSEAPLDGEADEYYEYNRTVSRYTGSLMAAYMLNKQVDFTLGYEYYYDMAVDNLADDGATFWDGKKQISYQNHAIHFQTNLSNRIVNATIGMRYDKHNQYGGAFIPRIALMKKIRKVHFKLLYNRAFRTPSLENIDLNFGLDTIRKQPLIVPEITDVYNFEMGYKISPNFYINANLFRITLDKTIVYSITEDGKEGYDNLGKTGSQGIELELKSKFTKLSVNANYSFYTTKKLNQIEDYKVAGNSSAFLGAPQHKITLSAIYKITNNFKINSTTIFYSKRYSYDQYDGANQTVNLSVHKPVAFINMFLSYDNLFVKGLNVGAGVYNISDSKYSFIQPYNGWHTPIPGKSREYLVKLNYNFNW